MGRRAHLIILDGFGVGHAPDAAAFGDEGADTFGHLIARIGVALPNLRRLGLFHAAALAAGRELPREATQALFGAMTEISGGKDTPSGHYEIAGVPVREAPAVFARVPHPIPESITGPLGPFLGNEHASGTEIIARLGEAHLESRLPIFYTSADSVLQIAAHEERFGLERLYQLCQAALPLAQALGIQRVIARPFTGTSPADFRRTANRKDFTSPAPGRTLLDAASAEGRQVISIGKIGDIFAHRGTGEEVNAEGNAAITQALLAAMERLEDGGLSFANLVDFDMLYGHRRDAEGFARALAAFDAAIPQIEARLEPGDMALITADHGCDPTHPGTDHTRERVPLLVLGAGAGSLGIRASFADAGQSLARWLGLTPLAAGDAFPPRSPR